MNAREKILGVEGGGTKTAWALCAGSAIVESGNLPPSNLRLTPPDQLRRILQALPAEAERVGIFLAGCATADDRRILLALAQEIWPGAQIVVGSDRDSGMAACLRDHDGIVVNAGTGSSVTGRRDGRIEKAGGWGHILGDTGGAYFVSIQAVRSILREYDLHRGEREFAARILAALGLNNFDELVRWAQISDKTEIAALAPLVFAAAEAGDKPAQQIIAGGAQVLAEFTAAVADRLELARPAVRLMGGLFSHQESYVRSFRELLNERVDGAQVSVAEDAPEFGAAWLAAQGQLVPADIHVELVPAGGVAVTEAANPASVDLEKMSSRELVELFVKEEAAVQEALRQSADALAQAIELASAAVRGGGRVIYVGAGTSGRLGVLDAAEIPPTFGAPPEMFQGIIAGGAPALQRSVEGAEDDARAGAVAINERNVSRYDLVIGISASGRAPFVRGALREARQIGARTILLTSNPALQNEQLAELLIALPAGPEILAGSTRLKAGTVTKVALNIISTGAMVKIGRVRGNLMVNLRPTNQKLRERAVRLVAQLTGCELATARERLERTDWDVRAAIAG